jgi:hypothetical protein
MISLPMLAGLAERIAYIWIDGSQITVESQVHIGQQKDSILHRIDVFPPSPLFGFMVIQR